MTSMSDEGLWWPADGLLVSDYGLRALPVVTAIPMPSGISGQRWKNSVRRKGGVMSASVMQST